MKKPGYLFALVVQFLAISGTVQFTQAQTGPGGVGNATGTGGQPRNRIWLSASSNVFQGAGVTPCTNGTSVQQWNDGSGNGHHLSQAGGNRPTFFTNVINTLPVVRFDGTNDDMGFGAALDNANALPFSFFAVTRNTTNPRGLFDSRPGMGDVFRFFNDGSGGGPGSNNSVEFWNNNPALGSFSLTSSGTVVSVVGAQDGSSNRQLSAYSNGTQVGSTLTGTNAQVGFTGARVGSINNGAGGFFNGDVAEMILFSTEINDPQRIIVENYLGARYNLSLTSNDYFSNTTFVQNLIGIGTTNGTLKHSFSAGGGISLNESGGTLNSTNEFIFAGHNGTAHSAAAGTGLLDVNVVAEQITTRWAREYLIEKTGTADLHLTFDYSQAGLSRVSNTPEDYYLLYRTNTGLDFTIVTLADLPDLSVAGRVTFSVENAHLANGYYTLGLKNQAAAGTVYSFQTNCAGGCDWHTTNSWTTDPSGTTSVAPRVPRNIDNVVVLPGNTVNVTQAGIQVVNLTISNFAILDLGSTTGNSISLLQGNGKLALSATSGTAVFPAITTNNHISTGGSTVEFNGAGTYILPAAPTTFRNLIITGGGIKSTTIARTVEENLNIGTGTSLTTSSDLLIRGNFAITGQLNQTGGTTTFGGTVVQMMTGSPSTCLFNNLTINNSGLGAAGTVYSSIDFTVAGNFISSSNNTTSFQATSGSVIISSTAARSIGGAGAGAVLFYNLFISGAGAKTIDRNFTVNNSLIVTSGGLLRLNPGTSRTITTRNLINYGTFSMGAPGAATAHNLFISGNINLLATSVLNFVNGNNVANCTLNGASQFIYGTTPSVVTYNNLTQNAGSTVVLTDFNLSIVGNLVINGSFDLTTRTANRSAAGGTISVGASGTLKIGGTNPFPTNYTTVTLTVGSTVSYEGTTQTVRAGTYSHLQVSGGTKTLAGAINVGASLGLNTGILALGNNNLSLLAGAVINGNAPSASNMIQASGTGQFFYYFDANGTFVFPVGTGSVYTPLNLNISATFGGGAGTRCVSIRPVATVAPSQLDAAYSLQKHWILTSANLSAITATLSFSYAISEENSTVEPIYVPSFYTGGVWTNGNEAEVASQNIVFNRAGVANLNGNYTAGPSVAFIAGNFYSFVSGTYETGSNWSTVGYGGPATVIPPTLGSSVFVGNNRNMTLSSGSKTIPTLTIEGAPNPGTLDIGTYTGITITTFTGSGTLRISASGATAVYPTATTNFFNSNAGSTTEYYGTGNFNLPAAPLSYRNLIVSGAGTKTLNGNTTVHENLNVASGTLQIAASNLTVSGTTNIAGTVNDNNNTGANLFSGNVSITGTGSLTTAQNSTFEFRGGITNNGVFSKTGTGAVSFTTNNQILSGSNPIVLAGAVSVTTGRTVENQNNAVTISNLSIAANARFANSYAAFPTTYTGVTNGNGIINTWNAMNVSNDAGNGISSSTGDNLALTRNSAGSVYALKSTNFGTIATAIMVRFDMTANSTVAATSASATLMLGNTFTDNGSLETAAARLQFNLGVVGANYSVTYPDGTPRTTANQNSVQTITMAINQSAGTVTYTAPNGAGAYTLASNRVDVWIGNTRFLTAQTLQDASRQISKIKLAMTNGAGSFTITNFRINPIGTVSVTGVGQSYFCITAQNGDSVDVNYSFSPGMDAGTHYNSPNTFTAQLSNAAGSFATPLTIGTLNSTALSGTITCMIPGNTAQGSGYRIRVVSSNPIGNATDNGSNLPINLFKIAPSPSQSIDVSGTGTLITATGPSVSAYQWGYYTILGGAIYDLAGRTASTYTPYGPDFPGAGTYSLVCRMTTSSGCGTYYSNPILIYINCPVGVNLAVNGDFSAGNSGFTSDYNYVTDNPAIQTEMYPEQTYAVIDNPFLVHNLFCNLATPAQRSPVSGGNMLVGNAATSGSLNLWKQDIAVTPNTDYVLSFYAVSLAGSTSSLLFGIYTGCYRSGADISVPFETTNCLWNRYSFQFNSGNNTVIPLAIRNISAAASGNDIAIDDIVVYACASVSNPPFIVANTPVWRGITNTWFNQDNWGSSCGVPSCALDVVIPQIPSNRFYPVIDNTGANARNVDIWSGARLTINSGFNLNVCGDLTATGTLTANGNSTITFTGSQNPASLTGTLTGSNKPVHLVVNKTNPTDTVKMTVPVELAGNLTITQGQFKTNAHSLKIAGNFSNSGTFHPSTGTVEFNGTGNQSISQTGTGSFYNLKNNNSSPTQTLTFNPAATIVSNQLDLTSGQAVTAGGNVISVTNSSSNSVINYGTNGYVRGNLRRSVSGTGSYDYPVGDATRYQLLNLGITSALTGTSSVTGSFSGSTPGGSSPTLTEAGKYYEYVCQNGYWTLTPDAQPSGGSFNLIINPVGFVCQGPYQTLAKRANSGAAWTFGGSTPVSFTQRNGFTSFSEIAQVDAEEPLPLDLVSFYGVWRNQRTELTWTTVNERDHDHIVLERSFDGANFTELARFAASAINGQTYQYSDREPGRVNYYRFKQVATNGSFAFSQVIRLSRNGETDALARLLPNPASKSGRLQLEFTSQGSEQVTLSITDLAGKKMLEQRVSAQAGHNMVDLGNALALPKGWYTLQLSGSGPQSADRHPLRFVLE